VRIRGRSFKGSSVTASPATAEQTQIVLQWLFDTRRAAAVLDLDMQDIWSAEDTLDRESGGLFEVDGHDMGNGAGNIFLNAADPDAAVARIVEIFDRGLLRGGLRIGVAQYASAARKVSSYRAVFPPGLTKFEIVL
jgi:hypothetical protein